MFDSDYQFFPSIHDITEGLSEAKLKSENWMNGVQAKLLFDTKMDGLLDLFEFCTTQDSSKPLTPKILKNTSHPVTKSIIKAYTSESLGLYSEINQMMRNNDIFKLEN